MKKSPLLATFAALLTGFAINAHAARGIITTKPAGGTTASGKAILPADSNDDSNPSASAAVKKKGKDWDGAAGDPKVKMTQSEVNEFSTPGDSASGAPTQVIIRLKPPPSNPNQVDAAKESTGAVRPATRKVLPTVNK